MNLIPWRKTRESDSALATLDPISSLWSEMDRLFDRAMTGGEPWSAGATWMPALDITEGEKDVTIRAEIPGVDPKDLDVSVAGDNLVISGEKKQEYEQKERGFHRSERFYGSFRRSVVLPQGVDAGSVSAEYKNGVLTIQLRKDEHLLPRKVKVKAIEAQKK